MLLFFSKQDSDACRQTVFNMLFGTLTENECKFSLLSKLVSMSVSVQNSAVLNSAAVWMQVIICDVLHYIFTAWFILFNIAAKCNKIICKPQLLFYTMTITMTNFLDSFIVMTLLLTLIKWYHWHRLYALIWWTYSSKFTYIFI